jgi:hypothetical protein
LRRVYPRTGEVRERLRCRPECTFRLESDGGESSRRIRAARGPCAGPSEVCGGQGFRVWLRYVLDVARLRPARPAPWWDDRSVIPRRRLQLTIWAGRSVGSFLQMRSTARSYATADRPRPERTSPRNADS